MKYLLITLTTSVSLGCTTTQSPEPTESKVPSISIHIAAIKGNIEVVKQHLAAGTDVNAKDVNGYTPLDWAVFNKDTKTADLLRKHGGKTGEELKDEGK